MTYDIPTADELDGWHPHDSVKLALCIDPDAQRCYVHARIGGSGLPAQAWRGLHPCLVLPRRVVGCGARALLMRPETQALLARIGAGVIEIERDGADETWGRLTDAASDALGALSLLCEELPSYCSVADWAGQGWGICRDEVRACGDSDAARAQLSALWVADARSNGAILHPADIERIMDEMSLEADDA